ncbi:arylesterase [Methylopila musalis]|uniref:Arylesterase n=1 Tax=Methylopila musalis TaxID=1134781 RepID=A0ABW3Z9X1_9HYPH
MGTADRAEAAEPVRLVALGDSLTAGYGLGPGEGFVPRLQKALSDGGRTVAVANAGVSGDTASGGADRLDWSVPDGTDGVIVALGANDMLRGVDPKITRAALTRILDRLKARNTPAMLIGMRAAPNLGSAYVAAFDSIYSDLAAERGLVLYPFFLDGVVGNAALNLADGLHPNPRGIDIMVRGALPYVRRFVDSLPGRS